MNSQTAKLYIVATPIGNLDDLSPRARDTLASADLILCEDTRHSRKLLAHFGIHTATQSFHAHNEHTVGPKIISRLEAGGNIALISDAGTPLISDPGLHLVRMARECGIAVAPVPGPCALIAALSVSGMPTHRFIFAGFVPGKPGQRRTFLQHLKDESRTIVLYESSHRILACLKDMETEFGSESTIMVAREMTKLHETFYRGSITQVARQIANDANHQKGEFVVILSLAAGGSKEWGAAVKLAHALCRDLPIKKAAKYASETFDVSRNDLYQFLIGQRT